MAPYTIFYYWVLCNIVIIYNKLYLEVCMGWQFLARSGPITFFFMSGPQGWLQYFMSNPRSNKSLFSYLLYEYCDNTTVNYTMIHTT